MAPIGVAQRVRIILENVDFPRQAFFSQSFFRCRQARFEQAFSSLIVDNEIKNIVTLRSRIFRMASSVLLKPGPVHQESIGGPTITNETLNYLPKNLTHHQIQ